MKTSMEELIQIRLFPHDRIFAYRTAWWDLLNERTYYDLVIHTAAILNLSPSNLTIEEFVVEAQAGDRLISSLTWHANELQTLAEPLIGRINVGLERTLDLVLFKHQALPSEFEPTIGPTLIPRQAMVIPNIYLSFHILPEKLNLTVVAVDNHGVKVSSQFVLKVIEYQSKNKYRLPVKGPWYMKAFPETGRLDHHRFGVSNEFGVDFLKIGPGGELYKNDGKVAADWYSHGEKVLAANSGKVVAVHASATQEWTRFSPAEGESDSDFQQRALREVKSALEGDVLDWAAGNYIVIEHSGGEFSSYLHLREESVIVREGDEVSAGDHIADVGNTGDSFGAHLHFQVTESKDLINGRSLPFSFTGVAVDLEEPGKFVRSVL